MKDNVYSVLKVLYSSMDNVLEDVELINFILIEFVSVNKDLLEKEKIVLKKTQ